MTQLASLPLRLPSRRRRPKRQLRALRETWTAAMLACGESLPLGAQAAAQPSDDAGEIFAMASALVTAVYKTPRRTKDVEIKCCECLERLDAYFES